MTNDPKPPTRDELTKLIAAGGLDPQSQVIAAALLEVLLGQDDIQAQLKDLQAQLLFRLVLANTALAEVHVIYGHLQEIVSAAKARQFGRAKVVLKERLQRLEREVQAMKQTGGKKE